MAYFYIRDDGGSNIGTATGDGGRAASERTGTWNAATTSYYSDLEAMLGTVTMPPVDGDIIRFANDHAFSGALTGHLQFNSGGDWDGDASTYQGVRLESVDVANQENYLPGASETYTTGTSYQFYPHNRSLCAGIDFTSDNTFCYRGSSRLTIFQDCTITLSGSSDFAFQNGGPMTKISLAGVTIDLGSSTNYAFDLYAGDILEMVGGTVTSAAGTSYLFGGNMAISGGAWALFRGVDVSAITNFTAQTFTDDTPDSLSVAFDNCDTGAMTFPTLGRGNQRITLINSGNFDGTADDETYNEFLTYTGTGQAELKKGGTGIPTVTADDTMYESPDICTYEVSTTARCSIFDPFTFFIPAGYFDFGSTSEDVLTFELITNSASLTLTDADFAIRLHYADGTTFTANHVFTGVTQAAGQLGLDYTAAGSTLSTSALGAGDYTNEHASSAYYKVDVSTTGNAGEATLINVEIVVYKPSITAGWLHISPQPSAA